MTKRFALNPMEVERLTALLTAIQRAEDHARVGLAMLLAQHEVHDAEFKALEGQELVVELPD